MKPLADPASERAYLGACVADRSVLTEYPVPMADFSSPGNRVLLGAMLALAARNEPIDTPTLRAELVATDRLRQAGGDDALLAITSAGPPAHVGPLVRAIRKMARLRVMRAACQDSLAAIEDHDEEGARTALTFAPSEAIEDEILSFRELMARGLEEAVLSRTDEGSVGGMRFGTPTFDRSYRPSPGHLVVVAARANVGKTSLTFSWHMSCAQRGIPSAIISLDDAPADYGVKGVGAVAEMNPRKIWNERLTADEIARLVEQANAKADLPIHFVKIKSRSIYDVEAALERLVRVHGIKWFSLDYLTKVRAPGRDPRERTNEALARLGLCASRHEIPGVVLAQLKRLGDGKSAKSSFREPTLEDLKETGDIEEHAQAALLLWKESDKKGAVVRAKNAKLKRDDAGERFTLARDPDTGLLVEESTMRPPGPALFAPPDDEDWS